MYVAYACSYAAGRTLLEPGVILRPRYSCICQSASPKLVFANLFSNFGMASSASRHAETQSHTCKLVASRTASSVTAVPFIIWTGTVGERPNGDIKRAAHGYEPTREAAMAAFAKSWRRS
jgi:hypothetical protein